MIEQGSIPGHEQFTYRFIGVERNARSFESAKYLLKSGHTILTALAVDEFREIKRVRQCLRLLDEFNRNKEYYARSISLVKADVASAEFEDILQSADLLISSYVDLNKEQWENIARLCNVIEKPIRVMGRDAGLYFKNPFGNKEFCLKKAVTRFSEQLFNSI
ncbi:MAG: hypothetical protein KKD05_02080 [Candidatus Omnitrophica bacterium]|nr:hypothetical protein [Candidatus Omnitrophota bacterium]